jgi:hypothetical protein
LPEIKSVFSWFIWSREGQAKNGPILSSIDCRFSVGMQVQKKSSRRKKALSANSTFDSCLRTFSFICRCLVYEKNILLISMESGTNWRTEGKACFFPAENGWEKAQ